MTKKRRAKKHSRLSRDQRLNAGTRMWVWESEPASAGNDFVLHVQAKPMLFNWCDVTDHMLIENLLDRPRNWVICGRALVLNNDRVWMEQADMTLPSCRLRDVQEAYTALREEVLAANQLRHVFDCGWIAQSWRERDPTDVDPDWVYHDAPPGLALDGRKTPSGLGYTPERHQRWQEVNLKVNYGEAHTSND